MKKNLPIIFLVFILFSVAGNAQTISPYLQAVTSNSIAINWKTSYAATPVVRYGPDSNFAATINGSFQLLTDADYGTGNPYYYHTVKLNGLAAATKYYYRVVCGSDSSRIYSFHTLPVAGAAPNASNHFRFLIMGDNQIKAEPRYDSLMVSAQRKMTELYGANFNDSVSFILNVGDQVDYGSLDHYENVHLKKSRYLSPVLPIFTAIGNHETYYGTIGIQGYYQHFLLDSMHYKGIYSNTEDYYAFQSGNVVFVYMNTEYPNSHGGVDATQFNWVKKVVDSANTDPSVKWIISIAHRPYQAEQYVGDISVWIRNTVVPYIMQSPKYFLHVGAHHHIYARGQMKNAPVYNIISGGTAWDQYWGMNTEQNFDDVQKTISNWAYQLVDVDMLNDKVDVTTYSIGSIYSTRDNLIIDSFHRYKNAAAPLQPQITNNFPDSLELPVTIAGSVFQSNAAEQLNSSEFQVASDRNFTVLEKTNYRHYEDLFGRVTGATPDTSVNQNMGLDIQQYTLQQGELANGLHYVRVRYRDRNQSWSPWSEVDSFKVINSILFDPAISLDTMRYPLGSVVHVTFRNGSTNANAWIGIYKKGQTPSSSTPATAWRYTNGLPNGTMDFTLTTSDEYFAAYFGNSGYTQIAPKVPFYYGTIPVLNTPNTNYAVGQPVPVNYTNGPALANDWIGVYKIGMTPGPNASIKWGYTSGSNGTFTATGLAKGYYFASYFLKDQYFEAGERIYFSVGDTITTLTTNKSIYNLGEYISASWTDGPGNPKDWLGIYRQGDNPASIPLLSYTYIDGQPNGTKNIPLANMPQQTGNYFIVLFTNDSYTEVSNRVSFQMVGTLPLHLLDFSGMTQEQAHLLKWKVAGENPSELYILQHSTDAVNFQNIYTTPPDLSVNGNYSFRYPSPQLGNNFYRLVTRSADGRMEYSDIINIHQNLKGENTVNVYPNPVQSGNTTVVESPYPIEKIEILDVSGQMIYQTKNINNKKFSLMHQDLPAGVYFVKIHSRKLYTARLVITK